MAVENPWGEETQLFYHLNPESVLDSIDRIGLETNGQCLPYTCFENRVFEIGLGDPEDRNYVIAKFYRPGRWRREQIKEEHQFLLELKDHDIPVVAPLLLQDQETLFTNDSQIFFTLFPRQWGRNPHELKSDDVEHLGRLVGRMHRVGQSKEHKHRPRLNHITYGSLQRDAILQGPYLPEHLKESYQEVVNQILEDVEKKLTDVNFIRVHGDCHPGNVLMREGQFFLVDFDDTVMAPAVQDLWTLLPMEDERGKEMREVFLRGYERMHHFDRKELALIDHMRALRLIHYTGWIAKRFEDPIFQDFFSHFKRDQYWVEHIQELREQLSRMKSSPYSI